MRMVNGCQAPVSELSTLKAGLPWICAIWAAGRLVDGVDLAAEQRVDARRVVGEVDDDQLVGVRLAVLPVVRVLQEAALLARGEAVVLVRAGADGVGRVVVGGDDAVEVLAEVVRERRVGELERHADGPVVQLLHAVALDVADRGGADLRVLRIGDPLEREDDVVGGDRLAVVEGQALLQADVPDLRALAGLDRLGQQHLQLGEVRTADRQRLVQVPDPHDVRVRDRLVGVDRVLRAAAGGTGADDPAGLELRVARVRALRRRPAASAAARRRRRRRASRRWTARRRRPARPAGPRGGSRRRAMASPDRWSRAPPSSQEHPFPRDI